METGYLMNRMDHMHHIIDNPGLKKLLYKIKRLKLPSNNGPTRTLHLV